ncbi:MAG: hypothetical protein QME45_09055 [Clostridiales bacterium]|nr:hypothetical protein [Clostridiales bacterium]
MKMLVGNGEGGGISRYVPQSSPAPKPANRGKITNSQVKRKLAKLNERISMWKQYSENKAVHKRFSGIKPGMRDTFSEKHRAELVLFDAAAKHFDDLKASGEVIDPKK